MKINGSIIKIDQINALAEFSLIHYMYINYLCVLLVLRQKTDPGLKQTPLGLHRSASLIDISILVLKILLNTCHSHFAADTTWVCTQSHHTFFEPLYFSKCPLTAMVSGGSDRLSTAIVDDRRSLTPRRCMRDTLPGKPHQPTSLLNFFKVQDSVYICRIACNLTCIWRYFASKKQQLNSKGENCLLQAAGHPQGRFW